jgi:transposase-like protein
MNKPRRFSPEVRERAVRLLFEHQTEHSLQSAAIGSIISATRETGVKAQFSARPIGGATETGV